MKRLALVLALFVTTAALAQPGGPSTGINGALLKMFGEITAFSAQGDVSLSDKEGKEVSSIPVNMSMLDGKLRAEMDMSQMKGGGIPADAVGMIKATGMDRLQILVNSNNASTLIIYPGLKAYTTVADEEATPGKVETTEVGKETIDGHACIKQKLTSTDAKGRPQEAFIWAATDLKNFPIKMEMKQKKNTIHIRFRSPSLQKPEGKLFEVPAGYTKYDSIQGLMQAAMMKMFSGGK